MYIDILREPHAPANSLIKPGVITDAGYDLSLADDAIIPCLSQVPRSLSRIADITALQPITLDSIGYKEDGSLPKDSPYTIKEGGIWQMRYSPPLFRTGIHTLPRDVDGVWFMVVLRSSSASKVGLRLHNAIGVIDAEYQDEILLGLYSAYNVSILLPRGERVAQLIPMTLPRTTPVMTTDRSILGLRTTRGGGWGSTNNNPSSNNTLEQGDSPLGMGILTEPEWGMSGGNVIASFET
ncbi:dUTP pyrophosphatase [Microcoleus phage My-WqHQDG]|nr:dUTP pyrophosphatase [Microcoleus phage My-WqHQDG]